MLDDENHMQIQAAVSQAPVIWAPHIVSERGGGRGRYTNTNTDAIQFIAFLRSES